MSAARAHLGVDGEHLSGRYVPVDLAEMFGVGDERVGVGGHVRAEEAGPICDRVCHGGGGDKLERRITWRWPPVFLRRTSASVADN